MNQPRIVGLILNYRDAARTLQCVHSLLGDGAAHVLVWDNSEDGGTAAANLQNMLVGNTRVSLEISPRNLGFAAGVNRGLAWIRARFPEAWVLLINNDAVLLPGAIDALTAALTENHAAVVAYPTIDHSGRLIGTAFYQRHFGLCVRKRLPGSIPYASGCCQLLAPERLEGVWFDEDFFMYGEDVELGHRLGEQRMVHVPDVWVRHEGSASSGMGSPFYEARMVAAHWLLARKLARNRWQLGLFWLGRIIVLPVRAVLRAWRYRSLIPLRSFLQGWRLACCRS